jgi:hypothetical protein
MIEGFRTQVETLFNGPVFSDRIAYTDVGLRSVKRDMFSNDFLGNLAVDAIREAGDADVAFDSPLFCSTQLFRGWVSTADVFNLFPHIFSKADKDSWTIFRYQVRGYVLKTILAVLSKAKVAVHLSNATADINPKALNPLKSFKIGGKEIELTKLYWVASTRGIMDVFTGLKGMGVPFMPKEYHDTKKVMWREVAKKLQELSPITADKVKFEARTRTIQPDLTIQKEDIQMNPSGNRIFVRLKVYNAGLTTAPFPKLRVYVDPTPDDSVDEDWKDAPAITKSLQTSLPPGEAITFDASVDIPLHRDGQFVPITAYVETVPGEVSVLNNRVTNDLEYLPGVSDEPPGTGSVAAHTQGH